MIFSHTRPRTAGSPRTNCHIATFRALVWSTVFLALAGCGGGGGDGGTGPGGGGGGGGGTPGFTIAASGTSLSVARGASGTVTVTVTRTGTFAGPVSLQATGQPAGVTAVFSAASVVAGQTTSTLTIAASAAAAAGTTPINIVANGAGVANQFLTIQLTVTAPAQAGPFALSLSVASYLALPPTVVSPQPILTITRNAGFTGAVTLSVSGLPTGLVVGVTPTNATGSTATLVILNGGAANGTYPITIRGVAAGLGEQSLTFDVVVAPPTTGSVQWQFCANGARTPVWFFAVKDGNGAWTRVVPNGTTYAFNVTGPTASVAMVTPEDAGSRTTIYQYSAQELAARAASECALYPGVSTRTATGGFPSLINGELAFVSMGWWYGSVSGPGSYSLQNLPAGPLDIVSVRGSFVDLSGTLALSRGIVRRATNPASGAANAPLDFTAAESFAMAPAAWTFGNLNGQQFSVTQTFTTAGGTYGTLTLRPEIDHAPAARTLYGIPAAQTVAGDLHQVIATIGTNTAVRATRQIMAFARTLAPRSVDFGPTLPTPTVSAVAGTAPRIRAQGTLPNEYNAGVSLDFSQPTIARFGTLHATRAGLSGASTYDVQMPDLTAVTGWDSRYGTRAGTATSWWVSGGGPTLDMFDPRYVFASTHGRWTGALTGITAPADGATYLTGRASGSVTP
jgi:hypothetical protein